MQKPDAQPPSQCPTHCRGATKANLCQQVRHRALRHHRMVTWWCTTAHCRTTAVGRGTPAPPLALFKQHRLLWIGHDRYCNTHPMSGTCLACGNGELSDQSDHAMFCNSHPANCLSCIPPLPPLPPPASPPPHTHTPHHHSTTTTTAVHHCLGTDQDGAAR
jgi:hypothetical protein